MKPFSRRQQNIEAPTPDPEAAPQALPDGMGEWCDDPRVDGVAVETITDREAHRRRGDLTEAQRAGVAALADLAARQNMRYEVARAQNELDRLQRLAGMVR